MELPFTLIAHLLVILAKFARPGGLAAVEVAGGQTPVAHDEAPAVVTED